MESFWGTIKQDLIHHHKYQAREQAAKDTSECTNIFYKTKYTNPQETD